MARSECNAKNLSLLTANTHNCPLKFRKKSLTIIQTDPKHPPLYSYHTQSGVQGGELWCWGGSLTERCDHMKGTWICGFWEGVGAACCPLSLAVGARTPQSSWGCRRRGGVSSAAWAGGSRGGQ